MLSNLARNVALGLRKHVGPDLRGIGPDIIMLLRLFKEIQPCDLRAAIEELSSVGFIRIDKGIPASTTSIPRELRGIAGVTVLERLQSNFDETEE